MICPSGGCLNVCDLVVTLSHPLFIIATSQAIKNVRSRRNACISEDVYRFFIMWRQPHSEKKRSEFELSWLGYGERK